MACLTGLSATKVPARSSRRAWLIALLNSACGNCFCTCSGSSDHAPKECDGNPRCGPRSARRLCSRSKSATLPCRRLPVPSAVPAPPIPPILRRDVPPPPPLPPIPPVPRWVSLSDSCWLSFSPARPLINGLAPLPVVGVVPVVVCCAAVALSCSSAGVNAPWLPAEGLVANTCDGCIPWLVLGRWWCRVGWGSAVWCPRWWHRRGCRLVWWRWVSERRQCT